MARNVVITFVDDIDGDSADETVTFALDGVSYEIDLSSSNAQELRSVIEPWCSAGRRVRGRRRTGTTARTSRNDLSQVRAWARENGFEVSDRGRVAKNILDAYDARPH